MNVAIIHDSRTGTTRAAAEAMAAVLRACEHEVTVQSVREADPEQAAQADALCIGSWTQGLFFVLQHPTAATLEFIDRLPSLRGKPAAVFCTYKTSPGGLLRMLSSRLSARGAVVTGQFKSRGPKAGEGFTAWVQSLTPVRTEAA